VSMRLAGLCLSDLEGCAVSYGMTTEEWGPPTLGSPLWSCWLRRPVLIRSTCTKVYYRQHVFMYILRAPGLARIHLASSLARGPG
jgi:hypothetical protein